MENIFILKISDSSNFGNKLNFKESFQSTLMTTNLVVKLKPICFLFIYCIFVYWSYSINFLIVILMKYCILCEAGVDLFCVLRFLDA